MCSLGFLVHAWISKSVDRVCRGQCECMHVLTWPTCAIMREKKFTRCTKFRRCIYSPSGSKFHWPMARNLRKKKTQPPLEVLDVKGLCEEWDACEEIRDRLRQGHTFLHPDTKDTVDGCCKNSAILVPILTRMAVLEFKSLPPVDPLRVEIDDLLVKNKRGNAPNKNMMLSKLLGASRSSAAL